MEKTNQKVPLYEKIGFSLIDGGYSMINYLLTAYLTIYLTDVIGVAAMVVSALLIIARIFDAVNDPIIGSLADRTKTKFGRYRPWILVGSIASGILVTLMFSNNPAWSNGGKAAYAIILYMVVTIATTSMYIPQLALNSVITSDNKQRGTIATLRMITSGLGTVVIPMVTMNLVMKFSGGQTATAGGYSKAVMLLCAIGSVLGIIGALVSKERLEPPKKQTSKIPMKQQMNAAFKNPAILLLILCFIIFGFIAYGRNGVMLYYFTYYVGNVQLYSIMGLTGLVGTFVGPALVGSLLLKFVPHKGRSAPIALLVVGLCYTGMGFLMPTNPVWWVLTVIASIFQSAFATIAFAALPEACDNGELISGLRVDGFLSSGTSFGLKFGSAIGPAIFLSMFDAAGYVANAAQNERVLRLMNSTVTFIPAVMLFVVAVLMRVFYKISPDKHAEIVRELQARRAAEEPQN